jgi:hypothetical protein
MLTTVDFTPEDPNRTRVTISWKPYGMAEGWTGSFDKLDAIFSDSDAPVSAAS